MKSSKIAWGIVLIVLGGIFLLETLDITDLSLGRMVRLFPLILIFFGLLELTGEKRNIAAPAVLLSVLGFGALLYVFQPKENDRIFDFKNNNNSFKFHSDEYDDESYDNKSESQSNSKSELNGNSKTYELSKSSDINAANLTLNLAAGTFSTGQTEAQMLLINANNSDFDYELNEKSSNGTSDINFKMKSNKGQNIDLDENDVVINLNNDIDWNIETKMGAGKIDFDLSKFKINTFELKAGAAEINLTFGSQSKKVDVEVNAGASEITIKIPKESGCRIANKSALTSDSFIGFEEVSKNKFETSNYTSAANIIDISLKTAVASIKVERY